MTDERKKKLSLKKPEQDTATPAAPEEALRRKPPVRGAGTAPRKRMTAAEAAQAREEAAAREEAWRAAAAAQERPPQRPPQNDPRRAHPRDEGGHGPSAPRGRGPSGPARHPQGDRPSPDRGYDRAPHAARDDQRGNPGYRGDRNDRGQPSRQDRGDPRGYGHEQAPSGGMQADHRPQRRDGRRADGNTYAQNNPAQHPPAAPREDDGRVRLSKLMSEQGLASRREADEWIDHGWVRVDGEVVSELGSRIFPDQVITIDPAARSQQAQRVTILIHKPMGYVSGQAEDGYEPAITLVRPENRWKEDRLPIQLTRGHLRNLAPAGRLDIDSTGLLVLTQDGRIAKQLIGEDSGVEKEYLVRVESVDEPEAENVSAVVPPEVLEQLRFGLELDGRQLKHAQVSWQNEQQLRFVLREGRKRQIRRMCELVGLKVVGLKRVRMGSVTLSKLPVGEWRFLRPDERF